MRRSALCVGTRGWAGFSTDSSDVARSPYPEARVWLPIALIGSSADAVRGTSSIIIVGTVAEVKAPNACNAGKSACVIRVR
jgi:predicted pyridoxine 5'-phosphate oxidase superfamily flavin-nucleotide-binding protein